MDEIIQIFSKYMSMGKDLIALHGGERVQWINKPGLSCLGYELTEMIGKPCVDFIHDDFKEISVKRIRHYFQDSNEVLPPIEIKLLRKNGTSVWFETSGTLLPLEDYNLVMIVGRDISEQKAGEELIIETVMSLLPDRLGILLRLLIQGKEYHEIMNIMNLDLDNVKRYHRRIYQHLVKNLDNDSLDKILSLLEFPDYVADKICPDFF